jgi:hypothetical protein
MNKNLLILILVFNLACDNSVEQSKIKKERTKQEIFSTESGKLKYHGYFYKNEVLDNKEELKAIREFANTIVFSTFDLKTVTPQTIKALIDGNIDVLGEKFFIDMSKRIDLLESMDYVTIGELPFYPAIRLDKFETYKKILQQLKKRVPQIGKLDYYYFWDEPDINFIPSPEIMEKYIEEFKRVFPKVKVTTCYAIPSPDFYDAVPPKNIDLLMIDPYFFSDETGENTPLNFEKYYQSRLLLTLNWIRQWDKPFFMVGDSFGTIKKEGKRFPTYDVSMWYYILATTQENCTGLLWFQYGYIPTSENITGVSIDDKDSTLINFHKEIGEAIFKTPSQLGLPMRKVEPPVYDVIKEALKLAD